MLIDSHCHVLKEEYDNPEKIIEDSFNNGVDKLIINGYDLESSKEAVTLSNKYKNVYATIGIGPENIKEYTIDVIRTFEELIKTNKITAIGEIGLDYYWTKENKSKQIKIFKDMLSLAQNYNLPVIVHSREAFEDTYNILKEYNLKGIIHCFSGSVESANQFIKLGFLIGIGGVITFKNAKKLIEVVENIDLTNISLETDSPYLAPEPYRGKQNMPKYVKAVAGKIANIKGININAVMSVTSDNVTRQFDL